MLVAMGGPILCQLATSWDLGQEVAFQHKPIILAKSRAIGIPIPTAHLPRPEHLRLKSHSVRRNSAALFSGVADNGLIFENGEEAKRQAQLQNV